MEDLKEIKEDVREIRKVLTDNTFRLAEYNAQLEVHIAGTKDLQARVRPIEEHVLFIRGLGRLIISSAAILGTVAGVLRLFLK